jgi:hypothetical protein
VGAGEESLRSLRQRVQPCADGSWTKASGLAGLSPTYR